MITSLKEGTICIRNNDKAIFLKAQEPISMELKAVKKLDKCFVKGKVIIELTWDKSKNLLVKNDTFDIYYPIPHPLAMILLQSFGEREDIN